MIVEKKLTWKYSIPNAKERTLQENATYSLTSKLFSNKCWSFALRKNKWTKRRRCKGS
jgi:hypothetical protein